MGWRQECDAMWGGQLFAREKRVCLVVAGEMTQKEVDIRRSPGECV